MMLRTIVRPVAVFALILLVAQAPAPLVAAEHEPGAGETTRPNIVFILADDLGYGDLGCYGQEKIQTPRLDRMAAEGLRFTQFYAGSTVCAPSRCVLMTGLHTGHCRVRGNADVPLRPDDFTVAELLKQSGYATSLIGKWGLGNEGSTGIPTRQGFDTFFGYLDQTHAHNYYPEFLYRNEDRVRLRNVLQRDGKPYERIGAGMATKKVDYSHDLFAEEALRWVEQQREGPFFLYLALTIPHANNEANRLTGDGQEVPDYGPYADKPWPNPAKGQAAMITRMDADVGRLLDKLQQLGIDKQTLVVFSSDNGPHKEGGQNHEFFDANGPLRGIKRDLYEGGIRVPTIAWWPGTIEPGRTSDHVAYFGDLMATAAELTGTQPPQGLDSLSFAPMLRGQPEKQPTHDYLYWEFHERGFDQAVRTGKWKAVRGGKNGPIELYDLESDLGETNDIAAEHPQVVEKVAGILETARTESEHWPVRSK